MNSLRLFSGRQLNILIRRYTTESGTNTQGKEVVGEFSIGQMAVDTKGIGGKTKRV